MRNDSLGDDPKAIWQQQRTEPSTMTLELIGEKARALRAETRRELFANITIALLAFAISVYGIPRTHSLGLQLAFAFAGAWAWALAGQCFLHWGMWSRSLLAEVASNNGLEFYRRELKRRQRLFCRVLEWTFGPLVLSICALILEFAGIARDRNLHLRSMIPFCLVFCIWIVVFFVLRFRRRRELQREIDELNALETSSRR